MPHSFGYRARTRDIFSKDYKKSGQIPLSRYLTTYKLGDYVDIKGDGAVHKGMPHKYYHGRTGIVWNVTARAVGVIVNKQVRNRIIKKKIHVRIEHVKQSNCRKQFLDRLKANQAATQQAKAKGETVVLKRSPAAPRTGFHVSAQGKQVLTLRPTAFSGYKVL